MGVLSLLVLYEAGDCTMNQIVRWQILPDEAQ